MSLYAVEYVYAADTEEGRAEHRAEHRALLAGFTDPELVKLVASGPYEDGTGAMLLFAAASADAVNEALKQDPFVAQGFVAHAKVTEWNPVTGELAAYAN